MRAFIKFNKGMLRMPVQWQLWLLALVALNLVVPLFFVGRFEARVVVIAGASFVLPMRGIHRPRHQCDQPNGHGEAPMPR